MRLAIVYGLFWLASGLFLLPLLDPQLNAGVIGLFWRIGHAGSCWIQIDDNHATEYGFHIEQGLGLVASFPEMAGAIVFLVGSASDTFVEAFISKLIS